MLARVLDLLEPPPLCGLFRWQQEGLCGQISGVFSGFVDWGLWTLVARRLYLRILGNVNPAGVKCNGL